MKKILLIEDDIVLRENTAELLELSGYNVIVAQNGKIGMDLAKLHLPDIVVCDIMMPELDGYGVLTALLQHEETKFIPFIYLSAKTERHDVRKGMNLGADDYITKPFTENELLGAIESRMAKASILQDIRERPNASLQTVENDMRSLNDLKNYFDDHGEKYSVKEGDNVFEEGQNSNNVYLITKGVIKCHKLDEHGKELTTALYKEDDFLGYHSFTENTGYQETATAIKNTEVMGLPKRELLNILNANHHITLELIQLLSDDLSLTKEQLLEMAYSSVYKKTAMTILKFAEKLNKDPKDPIRISRNDLASVAGIATETLIRTMSAFKKEGIIEIEGRIIKILDLEKLKSMS